MTYNPVFVATSPKSSNVLVYAEDIWDQIKTSNISHDSEYAQLKIKNALRSFAFNLIDIDGKRIFKDSKSIKIIKNLGKILVILKPDKGNGIVLSNQADYVISIQALFHDTSKFKELKVDPTSTRLNTLQSYLRKLKNTNKITEAEFDSMRPKNAKPTRASGLPRTHKTFAILPPF